MVLSKLIMRQTMMGENDYLMSPRPRGGPIDACHPAFLAPRAAAGSLHLDYDLTARHQGGRLPEAARHVAIIKVRGRMELSPAKDT